MQESGRAGRNNEPTEAILFYNTEDLGKHTIDHDMKKYCLLETVCRCQYLSSHFGMKEVESSDFLHNCCDNCSKQCLCSDCEHQSIMNEENGASESEHDPKKEAIIESALLHYFNAVNTEMQRGLTIPPQLHTGLTKALASDISQNYHNLTDKDTLNIVYTCIDNKYLEQMHSIIYAVISTQ